MPQSREKEFGVRAQQRLAAWHYCMTMRMSDIKALDNALIKLENLPPEELVFGEFHAAALYLSAFARKQETPQREPDFFIHDFLKAFHYVLQQHNVPDLEPQLGAQTIKRLYQLYDENPHALLATLALYDVHLDHLIRTKRESHTQLPILPLFENVFLPLVTGLNIWAIRRRWLMLYHQFHNAGELEEIILQYEKERAERETVARKLIKEFKQFLDQRTNEVKISIYDRTPASLFRSSINRREIIRAIVLKITCEREEDCYRSSMWLHQQGQILNDLSRNSLFHPSENRTRRMQVGIQLPSGRLMLARIGQSDYMDYYNEWGVLTTLQTQPLVDPVFKVGKDIVGNEDDTPKMISIFKWTGQNIHLENNSTVGDLVIQNYPLEQARYCTGAHVNAVKVSLGQQLEDGDVVQFFWERWKHKRLPLSAWQGAHRLPETWQAISYLRLQEQQEVLRGRLRILYVIQNYLTSWGFTLNGDQLTLLFRAAGFNTQRQGLNEILEQLTTDKSKDNLLCELALQFNLKQHVEMKYGDPLTVSWRNIRLAQCCLPTINDEIIGNRIIGPLNPDDPRFDQDAEIKIHKKNCLHGPEEQNKINLRWVRPTMRLQTHYGMKIHLQAEDRRGFLGELIDLIYLQTEMSLHYANADAVNYGLNLHGEKIANVILYVSASTWIELDEAHQLLKQKYGKENVTAIRLSINEARELTQPIRFNPYITESEPELTRRIPVLMVGRDHQIKQVMTLVSQRKNIHIAVEGYYRSGKTWFLNYLQDHYIGPYELLIYVPFDAYTNERIQERDIVHAVYLRTTRTINNADPEAGTRIKLNRPGTLFELQTWFERVQKITGYHFTLLMDEFSILNDWRLRGYVDEHFNERFYRFMYEAPTVGFIMVFQSALVQGLVAQHEKFLEWFRGRCEEVVYMQPFNDKEIAQLLCDPVRPYYEFEPDAVQIAWELSGGNPYIAAQLGRTVFRVADRRGLTKITRSYLQEIVQNDISPMPEWRAYLRRMVEHLPDESLQTMRIIAQLQCKTDHNLVAISTIQRMVHNELKTPFVQLKGTLEKLRRSYLLCANNDDQAVEPSAWKICGNLLAQYLAEAS